MKKKNEKKEEKKISLKLRHNEKYKAIIYEYGNKYNKINAVYYNGDFYYDNDGVVEKLNSFDSLQAKNIVKKILFEEDPDTSYFQFEWNVETTLKLKMFYITDNYKPIFYFINDIRMMCEMHNLNAFYNKDEFAKATSEDTDIILKINFIPRKESPKSKHMENFRDSKLYLKRVQFSQNEINKMYFEYYKIPMCYRVGDGFMNSLFEYLAYSGLYDLEKSGKIRIKREVKLNETSK